MFKVLISLLITGKIAFGYCYPDPSCEEVLKEENSKVLKEIDKRVKAILKKLNETEAKYSEINIELEKNIKDLTILLNQEILVNAYLNKILFEAKKEVSINATNNEKAE